MNDHYRSIDYVPTEGMLIGAEVATKNRLTGKVGKQLSNDVRARFISLQVSKI